MPRMFDMYQGKSACPSCGAEWDCDGQTKFFDPYEPFVGRCFSPGTTDLLEDSLERQASRQVWMSWFRVNERSEPDRLTLLGSLEDVMQCRCGTIVLPVLHFRFADGPPPTMTMLRLELRDARSPDIAAGVDFADSERLLWGDPRTDDAPLEHLAAAPLAEKVSRLRAAIAARIAEIWP
jgi:hypothetical protein